MLLFVVFKSICVTQTYLENFVYIFMLWKEPKRKKSMLNSIPKPKRSFHFILIEIIHFCWLSLATLNFDCIFGMKKSKVFMNVLRERKCKINVTNSFRFFEEQNHYRDMWLISYKKKSQDVLISDNRSSHLDKRFEYGIRRLSWNKSTYVVDFFDQINIVYHQQASGTYSKYHGVNLHSNVVKKTD